jgi:hypothetical protein
MNAMIHVVISIDMIDRYVLTCLVLLVDKPCFSLSRRLEHCVLPYSYERDDTCCSQY